MVHLSLDLASLGFFTLFLLPVRFVTVTEGLDHLNDPRTFEVDGALLRINAVDFPFDNEVSAKDPEVLHDTRSQKQASKKRPQEDHADTTKDSTLATAHETANNFVGVATRSSTRPAKRIKSSNSSSSKAGNQGLIPKIITLAINNFHFATAILTLHAKLSLEHENVHHSFG